MEAALSKGLTIFFIDKYFFLPFPPYALSQYLKVSQSCTYYLSLF